MGFSDVHRTTRLVLGAVCLWLTALPGGDHAAWLWLGLLLALAWWPLRRTVPGSNAASLLAETGVTVLAVLDTGASNSPLLPYLLAPLFSLGVWRGNRAVAGRAVFTLVALLAGNAVVSDSWTDGGQVLGEWAALGCVAGMLGAWARRLKDEADHPYRVEYRTARALLRQLQDLSRQLPGSLDPAAVADGLVAECRRRVAVGRVAVLTRYGTKELVPLALWGSERLPWPEQLDRPSGLWRAMESGTTVCMGSDGASEHAPHHLAFIPLTTDARTTGVLVAESASALGWHDDEIAALEAAVRDHELRLETALLFSDLRHTAMLEERERLAREMHNGVAQDLASIGFELDALRIMLRTAAPALADDVAQLRGGLTRMIQDIRYSISDLRTTVGPERGLGAALSTHLQTVGSTDGVAVHLSLKESPLRLPAAQEMHLFRVVQEFLTHARKHCGAHNVWASLDTDPPDAALELAHDGEVDRRHDCAYLARLDEHVRQLGARQDRAERPGGGERTEIHLKLGMIKQESPDRAAS